MSWFKKDAADGWAQGLVALAWNATSLEEFLTLYKPSDATIESPTTGSLLFAACTNKDPRVRVALMERLLDDGADAAATQDDGTTVLHAWMARSQRDADVEAPLLRRMLDGGADVNARAPDGRTPLEILAENFNLSDEVLAPFYDVILARPDLDLLQQGGFKITVLASLRKLAALRPGLVARAEDHLRERGLDVPEA